MSAEKKKCTGCTDPMCGVPPPPDPECRICKFYALDMGTCQRYAPRPLEIIVGIDWAWPEVEETDFCGEWRLKS